MLYDGVQLVQNSASLNGTQRVLLDGVITEEECSALKHLAHVRTPQPPVSFWIVFLLFSASSSLARQAVTVAGDGYRGRMSPHTPNEKFEGATVLKTLQVHSSNANKQPENNTTALSHCQILSSVCPCSTAMRAECP